MVVEGIVVYYLLVMLFFLLQKRILRLLYMETFLSRSLPGNIRPDSYGFGAVTVAIYCILCMKKRSKKEEKRREVQGERKHIQKEDVKQETKLQSQSVNSGQSIRAINLEQSTGASR